MFPKIDKELRVGYPLNGLLVLATNQGELKILDDLMGRGQKNGVKRLRTIKKKELFKTRPSALRALKETYQWRNNRRLSVPHTSEGWNIIEIDLLE